MSGTPGRENRSDAALWIATAVLGTVGLALTVVCWEDLSGGDLLKPVTASAGIVYATLGALIVRRVGNVIGWILLSAFTLAGYNLEAIRSFLAKKEAERTAAPPKRTRKKRRTGTWTDVIGSDRPESGRSPPST